MPRVPLPLRLTALLLLPLGCHRFPTDPDATRWPSPPTAPAISNVTGRVLVQGSGVPVGGATVWINDVIASSDAAGNYNLAGVRGPQVLVFAAKPGYDTLSVPLLLTGSNHAMDLRLTPH